MTDFKKMIGNDEVAQFLRYMREHIGASFPYWAEIEPILHDTFHEFDTCPDFKAPVDLPGIERLTPDERAALAKRLGEITAAYGVQCRLSLLGPLAAARAQLWALKKYGTTGE